MKTVKFGNINAETLFHATAAIEQLPAITLVGCNKHNVEVTRKVISFFLTTRMHFICKQSNINDNIEKLKTQESRKLAKLTVSNCNERIEKPRAQSRLPSQEIAIKKKRVYNKKN